MFISYSYAYLVGGLLLSVIWLVLFIRRKDLRVEMLTMSILATAWLIIAGLLFVNTYLKDYWSPQYAGILGLTPFFKTIGLRVKGAEDVLFYASYGGIAAVLYEEILGQHLKKNRKKNLNFLMIFPLIVFISFLITKSTGAINIIYGEYIGYLVAAIFIWWFRRDLLMHSLIIGILSGIFFFLFYILLYIPLFPDVIHKFWILHKTFGIFIYGLPLEEVLWAFFIGLWVGPSYEFIMGLKDSR